MSEDTQEPLSFKFPIDPVIFGGNAVELQLSAGVTTLVGPNGTGKTRVLRSLQPALRSIAQSQGRVIRFLAAGRSSPLEPFRANVDNPHGSNNATAHVGHTNYRTSWHGYESVTGDFLALDRRADLRLKVEARLQAFLARSLEFQWGQNGLEIYLSPIGPGKPYPANAEASGVMQLVPLLAAIYNDEVAALVIDEPEISLHPQYQAFLLNELREAAGDPRLDPAKKFVVIATHSPAMLNVGSVRDLPNLVFFNDRGSVPVQILANTPELKSVKLGSLVARLTATHQMAFFARNVLLVEGPSDEIVVGQLARKLGHPILASNTQIVPVMGKSEFAEAARLFELMGKRVTVLADLDAVTDDPIVVAQFNKKAAATQAASKAGHRSVLKMDNPLRSDFAEAVSANWGKIDGIVCAHPLWTECPGGKRDEIAKRRATLAILMTDVRALHDPSPNAGFPALRSRFEALFDVLEAAGCFVLRQGAIESYYSNELSGLTKLEMASAEVAAFSARAISALEADYGDVVRAIRYAAPIQAVDENSLLAQQLGAVLGTAFEAVSASMADEDLNSRVRSMLKAEAEIFRLANLSTEKLKKLRVEIVSPLFRRSGFPFDISSSDDRSALLADKLPRKV